ncbi:hypothetical protein [Staphylococcus succinus]|uniref:Phage protein n=1 Tax=Staphylococcus succinus TaxID=61015 RepID=A0ABX5ILD8_9STAP|nr:hypothetical protein [Staphylococcus succinus]PTI41385.1 hypothetical protein BU062_07565 [Staphylococcus succinus]PTI66967.1 hypothetical protein BU057_11395 [Staphylococcus succinus]RIN37590.1 hypothetical protein BU061_09595 [Staphylococcus succinus]
MNQLEKISEELNSANLERKVQAVLNMVCDRLTEDELAEMTFERCKDYSSATQAREFQDFNYIISSTLKMIVDEIGYTVNEINESIEKNALSAAGKQNDNAK